MEFGVARQFGEDTHFRTNEVVVVAFWKNLRERRGKVMPRFAQIFNGGLVIWMKPRRRCLVDDFFQRVHRFTFEKVTSGEFASEKYALSEVFYLSRTEAANDERN